MCWRDRSSAFLFSAGQSTCKTSQMYSLRPQECFRESLGFNRPIGNYWNFIGTGSCFTQNSSWSCLKVYSLINACYYCTQLSAMPITVLRQFLPPEMASNSFSASTNSFYCLFFSSSSSPKVSTKSFLWVSMNCTKKSANKKEKWYRLLWN